MSTYYDYYIGYITKDKKIYPIGPYGADGKDYPVLSRSRSFASDLHDSFNYIDEKSITDELKKFVGIADAEEFIKHNGFWLPIDSLPRGSYLKQGYYLIEDVKQYEKNPDDVEFMDIFIDKLSPTVYAEKLKTDLLINSKEKQALSDNNVSDTLEDTDDNTGEPCDHPATDYMYYIWPDYSSEEYEATIIRNGAHMFEYYDIPEGATMIAILIVD